jgi:hypothetical protein
MSMAFDSSLSPPPFAFQEEAAARIRDFLDRKARALAPESWFAGLESLVRGVEQALSNGLSLDTVRAKVAAARDWIVGRREEIPDREALELRELFERVTRWGRESTIENYPAYLVSVEFTL